MHPNQIWRVNKERLVYSFSHNFMCLPTVFLTLYSSICSFWPQCNKTVQLVRSITYRQYMPSYSVNPIVHKRELHTWLHHHCTTVFTCSEIDVTAASWLHSALVPYMCSPCTYLHITTILSATLQALHQTHTHSINLHIYIHVHLQVCTFVCIYIYTYM